MMFRYGSAASSPLRLALFFYPQTQNPTVEPRLSTAGFDLRRAVENWRPQENSSRVAGD